MQGSAYQLTQIPRRPSKVTYVCCGASVIECYRSASFAEDLLEALAETLVRTAPGVAAHGTATDRRTALASHDVSMRVSPSQSASAWRPSDGSSSWRGPARRLIGLTLFVDDLDLDHRTADAEVVGRQPPLRRFTRHRAIGLISPYGKATRSLAKVVVYQIDLLAPRPTDQRSDLTPLRQLVLGSHREAGLQQCCPQHTSTLSRSARCPSSRPLRRMHSAPTPCPTA